MDLSLPEELHMVRDLARDFTDHSIRPLSESIEREHRVPRDLIDQMAELGLMGVAHPEQYGGSGLGGTGLCVVMEELTRGDFAVAVTYGAHASIGSMAVLVGGTDEQKQRWLPEMAQGHTLTAYALSEANAGSDPGAMTTTAERDGSDWILNGEKVWITAGDIADLVTVYAITDKQKRAHGGVTAFLVPASSDGFSIGKAEEKMGQRGSSTVTLAFENVRVPTTSVWARSARASRSPWRRSTAGAWRWAPIAWGAPARPTGSPFPTPTSARPSAGRSAPSRRSSGCWRIPPRRSSPWRA